jgi:uncharacterized protein
MRMLLALGLTAATSVAIAQSPPGPHPAPPPGPATILVTGQAKVSETPDRVYIDIGVTTQAQKSEAATSENAARSSAIVAAVKRAAGSGAQLTTTEYSVSPSYNYPRDGGSPSIVGFTASNVVRVRLDDLRRIGSVIDAATQAGSNNVQDIRFALRDEQTPRAQALKQAALDARQDADALAEALGLRIVRILSVSEESPEVRPIPVYPQAMRFAAKASAPATPVEAGTLDVSATVTLTVEVAPAKR